MSLVIRLADLASRTERQYATGAEGIRRFANSGMVSRQGRDGGDATFWDGLARFGASLFAALTWQPPWASMFSLTNLWSKAVATYQFLFNFNWNATDDQLDQQIKQAELAVAAAEGGARGAFVGYLVCGVAPTAAIAVFNEPLALYVLKNLGEEAAEEMAARIGALIQLQIRKTAITAFINIFKNNRALIRSAALGFTKLLQIAGVPIDDEAINKANEQRDQPWSIATAMEDTIDRIEDPAQRIRVEEFWEEFGEACIEAGYIVAGSTDSWIAQQRVVNNPPEDIDEDIIIINPSGAIGASGSTGE
ncbi:hypothetical protein [Gloeocapsopsis sp. IPPAS B-1203]|uniref:hypothetical protein n=1 Tax=Gloeocapsopsis sp. IPPAS B-1203 TaxID=2049454 RepID=UPI000C18A175|nr:hypothetical protein [Gloeocapsopsis sp. IPPAS B-1203]PIG90817.1 hypothetical protein CSQ79_24530 [Gloeocapsopsis sp. IPPAS B-1203]